MKNIYSLAIALLAIILSSAPTTAIGADVSINATNFPDVNFRNWLLQQSYGKDGVLTDSEIKGVTKIDVSGTYSKLNSNKSLKGIEYFTALKELYCYYNQLITLDVSKNTELTQLYCGSNQLTSLDVSKNTKLTELNCDYNQLTSLNVLKNTALTQLWCGFNQLTSLDVSKNAELTTLYCFYNQLISIDVSKNTALEYLDCSSNSLTSLNVSKNTALKTLNCNSNQLTSLDVSKNTKLTELNCGYNQMTSLNVLKNSALTQLWCGFNQLTSLDISKNTVLKCLSCESNRLTSFDVSGCTALTMLSCGSNQLTSLDVTNNTSLQDLWCYWNQLTSLDISRNMALQELSCYSNQLTSLDTSNNTALTTLQCDNNQLISLNVSKNTTLTTLSCYRNKIKGKDMDNLISSLRQNNTTSTYGFYVIYNSEGDEGNVCTKSQVAAAKTKGWRPQYYDVTESKWLEYEGSEDVISDTDLSQLNNTVYINNVEVLAGTETTLSVRMKNTAAIRGFQFDLYLPKGVTAAKSSNGKIQATLNVNRLAADDEHTLTCNEQEDGSIRILCSSQYEETFTGNDGEVFTLQIAVSKDMVDDDYPVYLKNIKLSENNIDQYYRTELVKSTMTVISYMPGDVTGDGKVDVSDYIGVANRILNIEQEGFDEKAGDINKDGIIDVSDYIGVANIIHTGSPFGNGASRAAGSRRR